MSYKNHEMKEKKQHKKNKQDTREAERARFNLKPSVKGRK
jgi:hypothetical protein